MQALLRSAISLPYLAVHCLTGAYASYIHLHKTGVDVGHNGPVAVELMLKGLLQ